MECGVEDALIRASRTVVETYKREPLVNHQTRKEKKRERTWGDPKKTRGFFLEEGGVEDEVAVAELKQHSRRKIVEEFILWIMRNKNEFLGLYSNGNLLWYMGIGTRG